MHAHVIALRVGQWQFGQIFERMAEAVFDELAKGFDAVVVDHELEPRLDPREAVLGGPLPDVDNRPEDRDRLFRLDEDAEMAREARRRRLPAPYAHRETFAAVANHADQRDAIIRARRDRDLVLARQIGIFAIAVEELRVSRQNPGHIERLVAVDARNRASRDIPHHVAATAHRREPGPLEPLEDLGEMIERHVMQLEILPRGQLALVAAILLGDFTDRPQAFRAQAPARNFDAHHEGADLGLIVIHPKPLKPDDVLLGELVVRRVHQALPLTGQLGREKLMLQPLNRVALEYGFPGWWFTLGHGKNQVYYGLLREPNLEDHLSQLIR